VALKPDTRQRIVETAAVLFHTHSYTAVGIASVCDQAGVSKGSFFHFFRSKQELALAVLDYFRDRIDETLITRAFSPEKRPLERLDCFVEELYVFQKALADQLGHVPGCPFGNMAVELATQDEVLRHRAEDILRALAKQFQSAISDAVQSGTLPAVDESATAEAMLSYLEGVQLLAKVRNEPDLIRQLGPAVTSIRVPREA
jgi:TetR/AcrR family transcriptional repressor of nem operon